MLRLIYLVVFETSDIKHMEKFLDICFLRNKGQIMRRYLITFYCYSHFWE